MHAIGDRAVDLAPLAEHVAPFVGVAIAAGIVLRYGSDALLRLVAGITAIVAKDGKRSRAERALDVLRALRRDDPMPPGTGTMQ
jgi:hypothetical protein